VSSLYYYNLLMLCCQGKKWWRWRGSNPRPSWFSL